MRYRKLELDHTKCDLCGKCKCPFGAIEIKDGVIYHKAALCQEGCRACELLCDRDAIEINTYDCKKSCGGSCGSCGMCGRR